MAHLDWETTKISITPLWVHGGGGTSGFLLMQSKQFIIHWRDEKQEESKDLSFRHRIRRLTHNGTFVVNLYRAETFLQNLNAIYVCHSVT